MNMKHFTSILCAAPSWPAPTKKALRVSLSAASTMRNNIFTLLVALLTVSLFGCERENVKPVDEPTDTIVGPFDDYGASVALFSVADGRQVRFSKGNLQYCAVGSHTTTENASASGIFRFADHQYDYLGEANALVSDTNSGWIDLLCWGSSGWHVSPSSLKDGDYDIESLCGSEAYADWGVYNAISNGGDRPGMWRTLTSDEWEYLVNQRAASSVDGTNSARYAEATVAGTAGLILFPDRFERPSSLPAIVNINNNYPASAIAYDDNVYSTEEWSLMEQAGAIFLPAAGYRGATWLSTVGEGGSYWASTCNDAGQAHALLFINGLVNASASGNYEKDRGYGRSVRLVKDK